MTLDRSHPPGPRRPPPRRTPGRHHRRRAHRLGGRRESDRARHPVRALRIRRPRDGRHPLRAHIRLFSPWRHLVDPASERLLAATNWHAAGSDSLPTGNELVDEYLAPLAGTARDRRAHPHRRRSARRQPRRHGSDAHRRPGGRRLSSCDRATATEVVSDAAFRAVIDASGTYRTPNSLASSGLDPLGLEDVAEFVAHALPDVLGQRPRAFRREAHHGRGGRALGGEPAAEPRDAGRGRAGHPHHLGHPQPRPGARVELARRRAGGTRQNWAAEWTLSWRRGSSTWSIASRSSGCHAATPARASSHPARANSSSSTRT